MRPMLRSIQGVAEINSIGGYVKEYHVLVDPNRLRHYDLTLAQVDRAIASNNANASGNILPMHAEQYLIRGVGPDPQRWMISAILSSKRWKVSLYSCGTWPR